MALFSTSDRAAAHPGGLSDIFAELQHNVDWDAQEQIRVGVVLSAVGRRTYGPLLLIVGLFSISPVALIPGVTWACAALMLLLGAQMALGLKTPWLPRALLNLRVPRKMLGGFLNKTRPHAERLEEHLLQERLLFLTAPPAVMLVGLFVAAAALVTFPLSFIPFTPLAPSLAVILVGLGMTARDGVWVMLGMVVVAAVFALAAPLTISAISLVF